ncbi:MAG TPA: sigma factor-like helix-turn-helix DNA-binding protein, partial [Alphaproteobacteria bacterium]|nr:sigma factor-like helix-turn-helix DNA-binding protein [Alphaproteobacteria bacterium]
PATLDELSKKHGISRERVRQIEARAFEKLQQAIKKQIDNPPILAALPSPSSDL